MTPKLLLSAAALALALAAPALADDAAALYGKRCASCHGKDGTPTTMGQRLGTPPLASTKLSEEQVAAVISDGRGKMPGFKGRLGEEEIAALAKYVKAGLR